ncbi:hypothetical protein [Janthinobacterium sp. PSPC2-1]|uniref:hypothetical protein n=1 Tax=unclassified Janthinobacterium TaxID=2610881 RepID=UPI003CF31561
MLHGLASGVIALIVGAVMLALGASMVGNYLWNLASRLVPVTLLGQLLLSQTLFVLLYGFVYAQRIPRPLERAAMLLLTAGVLWSVQRHAQEDGAGRM